MKNLNFVLMALIGLMITACANMGGTPTSDIHINTKSDQQFNVKNVKSYAWFGTVGVLRDTEGNWVPPEFDADSELRFLVNRELRKHGMSETANKPDVVVSFVLAVNMDNMKMGKDDPNSNHFNLENVPNGALVVLLAEPESQKVLWTGVATAEKQTNATTEIQKKRLDYVVTEMLDKLPN